MAHFVTGGTVLLDETIETNDPTDTLPHLLVPSRQSIAAWLLCLHWACEAGVSMPYWRCNKNKRIYLRGCEAWVMVETYETKNHQTDTASHRAGR